MPKDSELDPKPRAKGCSCLTIAIVLAIPLLAILLGMAWLVGRDAFARSKLQKEIKNLEAKGSPVDDISHAKYHQSLTSDEDTARWIVVLEQLASADYNKELKELETLKSQVHEVEGLYRVPVAGSEWPEEKEFRDFLERWIEIRSTGRGLALKGKKVRFPLQFNSYNTQLTNTQRIRELARLLVLESEVAIRDRDSKQSEEAILAIRGCSTAIQGEPFLVSQMVSYALEGMAWGELRCALEEDVLNTESLRRIQRAIESRPSVSAQWKQWVNGERAGTLPVFTNPALQKSLVNDSGISSKIAIPARSKDALLYLEIMQRAEELATDDIEQLYASATLLDNDVKNKFLKSTWLFDRMISGLVVTPHQSVALVAVSNEMLARLASLAIGIRIYEKETGQFPTALGDLEKIGMKPNAMTPIGSKPFGYLTEEKQATLWGFSPRTTKETPDTPDTASDAAGYEAERWIWRLPKHE